MVLFQYLSPNDTIYSTNTSSQIKVDTYTLSTDGTMSQFSFVRLSLRELLHFKRDKMTATIVNG